MSNKSRSNFALSQAISNERFDKIFKDNRGEMMYYNNLTIHQKISLKEMIISKQAREQIGIFNHKVFEGLHALALIEKNFISAINRLLLRQRKEK